MMRNIYDILSDTGEKMRSTKKKKIEHWQFIAFGLYIYDVIAIALSYFFALWVSFECRFSEIESQYLYSYIRFIPIYVVFCLIIFSLFKLYKSVWRFVGFNEMLLFSLVSICTSIIHVMGISTLFNRMPLSYHIIGTCMQAIMIISIRFSYRFFLMMLQRTFENAEKKNVIIIGAGNAGQAILRDIINTKQLREKVICFIDDNPNKWNRKINGVEVFGNITRIKEAVEKFGVQKIYIAIPSAPRITIKNIIEICTETSCEVKNLPSIYQLATMDATLAKMEDVSVEDLLGREPICTDMNEVFDFIFQKIILVTGAGGSIGSEICRQIAAHNPKKLILFDIYENNAYDIQFELKSKFPNLDFETIIGSVRDSRRLYSIFDEYRPQIVYHAAAHKHVPLMEDSPNEAIKNNVIGTYKTAYAAMAFGCEKFVLISTDKAVNPTNIMGASKRICEMIIQSFNYKVKQGKADDITELYTHAEDDYGFDSHVSINDAKTEFVAVRFGNVLGSNGSVIPLFKKQIENGGPVTVTHPEIIRYFMTISEAVGLVLTAGTYASGGEIFVLDMGSPVKIDTLARNMIKLSGYKPDEDIKIVYTGLRPGEKLYEEKLMAEEGLEKTKNDLIHIGKPIKFDIDLFLSNLKELMISAYINSDDVFNSVQKVVSTYHRECLPDKEEIKA